MANDLEISAAEPRSQRFQSQALDLHYLEWGSADAPLLVLVHGNSDHARSWEHVALPLSRKWHVVALDLRGHGDSDWSAEGAYLSSYHVMDLLSLIERFPGQKATIVAHSFGGNISARLAAAFPDRVERIALIDGFGPPPESYAAWTKVGPAQRTRDWIERKQKIEGRPPRSFARIEDAAERLLQANPALPVEQAHHLALHGLSEGEAGFQWKHDPLVALFAPEEFAADNALEVWGALTCPVLLCYGANSWNKAACTDGRADMIPHAKVIEIADAGHWPHHEQRSEFLRVLGEFLG